MLSETPKGKARKEVIAVVVRARRRNQRKRENALAIIAHGG
jgi:hypothetical protein